MKLRPTYAIMYRYFCILRGSPDRILGLYIWMLIDMVLWGFISSYIGQLVAPGFNAISAFLGAVLLANFYSRVMLNTNMTFFEDMWSRNLLNLFASPLTITEYLVGLILCGLITSSVGLLIAFGSASLLFGFSPLVYGPTLLPFLAILCLFGIALGIFGCAVVLSRGSSAEWFIWPIPAIISPFVGVYYPVATLPEWMQSVAQLLPPSYVFEGLRHVLNGEPASLSTLAQGAGLSLGYILVASLFFLRIYRRGMRTGRIARYSAESVN